MVAADARRSWKPLRRKLESTPLGRFDEVPERSRLCGTRPLHGLADRPGRPDRKAPLVRPGDAARRPGLRLCPTADPRETSRRAARDRRRQSRSRDRVESTHASARVDGGGRPPPPRPRTATATPRPRLSWPARRRTHAHGLLRWTRLRACRQHLHARQRHRLPAQLPQPRLHPRDGRAHRAQGDDRQASMEASAAFAGLWLCNGRAECGVHGHLRRGGVRIRRCRRPAAVVGSGAGWNKCLPRRCRATSCSLAPVRSPIGCRPHRSLSPTGYRRAHNR